MNVEEVLAQVGARVSDDRGHVELPVSLIDGMARRQLDRGAPPCCVAWSASHFPAAAINGIVRGADTFWVPCDEHRATPPAGFAWEAI